MTGQCFSDSGKCPADPVDCIATRNLVGIRSGKDAIDSNLRLLPNKNQSGAQP